jgi:hypothetical protein
VQSRQNPNSHPPAPVHPVEVPAAASIIALEPGLFAIDIGPLAAAPIAGAVPVLPLVQVSPFPSVGGADVEILGEHGNGRSWVGSGGGVVVVRSPPGGGAVVVTSLGSAGTRSVVPAIRVSRLGRDDAVWPASPAPALPFPGQNREIPAEILLHVERLGDCRFGAQGWVGPRGQRLRIEGFAITPLEGLSPRDLEYMAFQPGGAETPWVGGQQFCGSRQRRLPLTGFAIRLAANLGGRFDVVYSGAFLNSGIVGPRRNGEPCRPTLLDDPLEAMTVQIVGPAQGGPF